MERVSSYRRLQNGRMISVKEYNRNKVNIKDKYSSNEELYSEFTKKGYKEPKRFMTLKKGANKEFVKDINPDTRIHYRIMRENKSKVKVTNHIDISPNNPVNTIRHGAYDVIYKPISQPFKKDKNRNKNEEKTTNIKEQKID